MEQENLTPQEMPQAAPKRSLWPLFFLPMALIYHELLLHIFDRSIPFWDLSLVYILLFSAAVGKFLTSAFSAQITRRTPPRVMSE